VRFLSQMELPLTFEDPNMEYSFSDFGGNYSNLGVDPMDPTNVVAKTTKSISAQVWSGTSVGNSFGFGNPIPFSATDTRLGLRVFSPSAGIPIRMKVEDSNDSNIFVETESSTTQSGGWETVVFDFSNNVPGTGPLDPNNSYDLASLQFHYGANGAAAGADTVFYWDDLRFLNQIDLPVTFEELESDYSVNDFGGNYSALASDPVYPANTVMKTTKSITAQVWSGTGVGLGDGFANAIPFTPNDTKLGIKVFSPNVGIPIRVKIEDSTNPAIFVETEVFTTQANVWESLVFDFNNAVPGTGPLNTANSYNLASISFNYGLTGVGAGADTVFYWDDVRVIYQIDLPVTFDELEFDYSLEDFGGNYSFLAVDPQDPSNTVAKTTKSINAQIWSGTTIGQANGFSGPIPFTSSSTKIGVKVFSSNAGIPIRMKVEDANNNTVFVETESFTTQSNSWEDVIFDFSNPIAGSGTLDPNNTYDLALLQFYYGTDGANAGSDTVFYWDDVRLVSPIDLPVDFEEFAVDYTLTDFGGNYSVLTKDPLNPENTVGKTTKSINAEVWAGTSIGTPSGFTTAIPFSASETRMSMQVYSPAAGIPLRLKVEDSNDDMIFVETETLTTQANSWELIVFDFNNPAAGSPALDLNQTYDLASAFFFFGTAGSGIGADSVYYWDDVIFGAPGPNLDQIDLPVNFENPNTNYSLTDFGGNYSAITTDPVDPNNSVAQTTKSIGAETWSGTSVGTPAGFATDIPFTINQTKMQVRVFAPAAGIPIRLKVEDSEDDNISVETEVLTNIGGAWDTLVFDFSNPAAGSSSLDFNSRYNLASLFFFFGSTGANIGADSVYYWDDLQFGAAAANLSQIDLPVSFDDPTVDYSLIDQNGGQTSLVFDPFNPNNPVAQTIKGNAASDDASTIIGKSNGFANAIPFTISETKMSIRFLSPAAGIPVRMKVEDVNDPGISVITETVSTIGGGWETMIFDFNQPLPGTLTLNPNSTYQLATIYFNFGTSGSAANGDTIFYWDDVQFGEPLVKSQIDLPVSFDDPSVDYTLLDFGGNLSESIVDPFDPNNMVAKTTKPFNAEIWAGTTIGTLVGFANPIPFTANATKMNMRIYSPKAGIPIRMKVEDSQNSNLSVEVETFTTVANAWEILEFDFSDPIPGTTTLNFNNSYDLANVFFYYGFSGQDIGADSVFYWDDVKFGAALSISTLDKFDLSFYPNPVQNAFYIEANRNIESLVVYDAFGKALLREESLAQKVQLDLSHFPSGFYFVKVSIDSQIGVVKILKK
ncbi:MAG: T9SS type A sorting domain-containing protein, partial [Bacteroidota bacterium]